MRKYIMYIILSGILVFLLCFIYKKWDDYPEHVANAVASWSNTDTPEARGQYGDQFGGLNTLFTGFAFAALIVALLAQMYELHLQRTEIRESTKQLEKQAKVQQLQLTDSTFFKYIDYYYKTIENLTAPIGGGEKPTPVREAFRVLTYDETIKKQLKQYYSYVHEMLRFINEIDGEVVKHKDAY